MSNQTYEFSSILENAWNVTWNIDSSPGRYVDGDSLSKDTNDLSISKTFLSKLGLISGSNLPDVSCRRNEDETSPNWPVDTIGLSKGSTVNKTENTSRHSNQLSDDSSTYISRDGMYTYTSI